MSRQKLLASVALLSAALLGVAADKKADPAKEEMARLQGKWQVIKWIDSSGVTVPADEIKVKSFEFKEDHLILWKGKDLGEEFPYTIDPSKDPKWINLDRAAFLNEGIYKLEGDKLTLCILSGYRNSKPAPRPKEFKAREREKYTVFVLKKIKK